MSHKVRHTTVVRGTFCYNRRVPAHAIEGFGQRVVRCALGKDEDVAVMTSEGLSAELETVWSADTVRPISVEHIVARLRPKQWDLLSCMEDYFAIRSIQERLTRLAVDALIHVAGNRPVQKYSREDARRLVKFLRCNGNKTATVRRRIQSLHAVLEFGFLEQDIKDRNPFSRLTIPNEKSDATKRLTFTDAQLQAIYGEALKREKDTTLVLPILGETGERLAEIVGLRWSDVDPENGSIWIRPHSKRRLKTRSSERIVPLVGSALAAIEQLHSLRHDSSNYVFPRWEREGHFVATHASNTLNKHLRGRVPNRTV